VVPAAQRWWLVLSAEDADACDFDPGYPVVVTVETGLKCLSRVWRGDISWREAVRSGDLTVTGSRTAARALPRWLNVRPAADDPRPAYSATGRLAADLVG
jgi:hypothetical protein